MSSLIECPVCEEQFQLAPGQRNKQVTCPSCQRSFELATSVPVPIEVKLPTVSPARLTSSELATTEKTPMVRAQSDPVIDPTSKTAGGIEIRPNLFPRKRKKFDSIVVGLICFVTVIGVAIGLFYLESRRSEALTQLDDAATEAVLPQPESVATGRKENESSNDNQAEQISPQPRNTAVEFSEQKLRFFSKKQIKKSWSKIQPHLVSLEIENQFGKHAATGTIIDSRGWVVTSYQAIKDAWRIQVTAADKSLAAAEGSKPLQDLVQGIVATDPENNLAILAVNRRFVVSLADVGIADKNQIVKGEYLIQAAPPAKQNPFGSSEVRIQSRGSFDGLEKKARLRAESLDLSQSDLTWLTFEGPIPTNAGMPLFRVDGTLMAMTVFRDDQTSYGLSVHHLRKLIDSTNGTIEPIRAPVVRSPVGETVALSDDSVAKQLIIDLNQAGQKCEPFQFLPDDEREYSLLKDFAKSRAAAFEFIVDYEGEMDSVMVQMQLDQWGKKLTANIQKIFKSDPDRIFKLNQFAGPQIKRGDKNHVVFLGTLYIGGIQSSRLILKFYDSELFVSAPFDPEAEPMLPGSHWLFFVETPARARRLGISVPGDRIIPTETALIHYAVGPIEE
jgi:S1-C subfamily serine protease